MWCLGAAKCLLCLKTRDTMGASAVAGDLRWSGSFGVNVDFVARSHCSVEIITLDDIQVSNKTLCGIPAEKFMVK